MRLLITFLIALAIAGCGNPPPPDNRGDACVDLAEVICERAVECGFGNNVDGCESAVVGACCGEAGTCGRNADLREDAWYECLDDLSTLRCSAFETDTLPVSCQLID